MKTESIASTVTCARNFLLEAENYMDVKDSYRDSVNRLIKIAEEKALSPAEPEINVKPLSLKELKEMDGEPVWCELYSKKSKTGKFEAWGIIDISCSCVDFMDMHLAFEYYERSWKAYKVKVKEQK